MPLHTPTGIAERILVVGHAGSAKTTHWLRIARTAQQTRSKARFFVADTDAAVQRMLVGYPELDPDRIILHPCYEWTDYISFLDRVRNESTMDDWVIVDFISSAWTDVQEYYTEQIFDQGSDQFFLEARKSLKKDSKNFQALDGWKDWTVINGLYNKWIHRLTMRTQANLYCTAKADQLSDSKKPTEPSQLRQLWLTTGIKPVGQKDLSYQFHTLLHSSRSPKGEYILNTVKDRERPEMVGQVINNFPTDYLVKVAGWKLA